MASETLCFLVAPHTLTDGLRRVHTPINLKTVAVVCESAARSCPGLTAGRLLKWNFFGPKLASRRQFLAGGSSLLRAERSASLANVGRGRMHVRCASQETDIKEESAERPPRRIASLEDVIPRLELEAATVEDLVPVLSQTADLVPFLIGLLAAGGLYNQAKSQWLVSTTASGGESPGGSSSGILSALSSSYHRWRGDAAPAQTPAKGAATGKSNGGSVTQSPEALMWADEVLPQLVLDSAALEDIVPILASTSIEQPFGSALWTLVLVMLATAGDVGTASHRKRQVTEGADKGQIRTQGDTVSGKIGQVLGAVESSVLPIEATLEDLAPLAAQGADAPIVATAIVLALVSSAATALPSRAALSADRRQPLRVSAADDFVGRLVGAVDPVLLETVVDDLVPALVTAEETGLPAVPALWTFLLTVLGSAGTVLLRKNRSGST